VTVISDIGEEEWSEMGKDKVADKLATKIAHTLNH